MLVSHRKKFIYTKTAKTAGTSVESFFERYCMPEGAWTFQGGREEYVSDSGIIGVRSSDTSGRKWRNHMPALEIKNNLAPEIWSSYFKFCCVRNPFDKIVSAFFNSHVKRNGVVLDSDAERIACFRDWVKSRRTSLLYDGDRYLIDGSVCVDFFIRYEDLENGVREVCRSIGVETESIELPRMKAAARNTKLAYTEFYDRESIEIVKKYYAFELALFNYTFGA
jgi:hypothetical protein